MLFTFGLIAEPLQPFDMLTLGEFLHIAEMSTMPFFVGDDSSRERLEVFGENRLMLRLPTFAPDADTSIHMSTSD